MKPGLPRWVDITVARAVLVLGAPLWVLIAVAVRASSPGPVLHRSVRVGRHGQEFQLLKFRTMRTGTSGPAVTVSGDDRVTSIGRFLRKTKLDEVPQLLNVNRGEMALVGPRPEDPKYVAGYDRRERRVLEVRPGLTSPASIRYRHEEQILAAAADLERCYREEVLPDKLRMDIAWLADRTAWGDVRTMARTARAIASRGPG